MAAPMPRLEPVTEITLFESATAGHAHREARVAYGRARMIVFPLIRSVWLRAATASSRAAALPMFVRTFLKPCGAPYSTWLIDIQLGPEGGVGGADPAGG
jgi:hypothetical protein